VRQAGSYVGPDKLRFDFTHGSKLSEEDVRAIEDQVNAWIVANDPVRPIVTTLEEAKALGATALFGEKYGDIVRMVEIGDGSWSRELCGGTHVRSTAEIGLFTVTSEGSSAANVRRIEAITGREAIAQARRHDALLHEAARTLRTQPERVPEAIAELQRRAKEAAKASRGAGVDIDGLAARGVALDGARVVVEAVDGADVKALVEAADRVKGQLGGEAAVVLGTAADERVHLVAAVTPGLVSRGVRAGAVVKVAAQVVGGGGGGRDTMAQAGGREPSKLPEALDAARAAIAQALGVA
jgi:alanyl-tRNA synthetase